MSLPAATKVVAISVDIQTSGRMDQEIAAADERRLATLAPGTHLPRAQVAGSTG